MKTDAYKEIIGIIKVNLDFEMKQLAGHIKAIKEMENSIKRYEAKIKEIENEKNIT